MNPRRPGPAGQPYSLPQQGLVAAFFAERVCCVGQVVQHSSPASPVRPVRDRGRLGQDGNRFPQVGVLSVAGEPVGQLTAQVVKGCGPPVMAGRCRLRGAPRETESLIPQCHLP